MTWPHQIYLQYVFDGTSMSMSYAMVASRLADLLYTIEVLTGSESESEYDYFFSKKKQLTADTT